MIEPVMKILCGRNTFGVNGGQSLVSFILLYLIGGMLRLDFPHTNDLKSRWFVAVGLAFIALLPLSRYTIDHLTGRQTAFAELLYMNISLPVVIASVCFFLAALNWRHNVAWRQNIASLTGDIYMAHENYAWYPLLWAFVDYPGHWSSSGIDNGLYFFATVTVIFAAGIGVGMARRWFFKKSKICTALSEGIVHIYEKYI